MPFPRLSLLTPALWTGLLLTPQAVVAQSPKPRSADLLVRFQEHVKGQGFLYGFKNAEGKIAIPPQYAFASDFSEGYAVVFKTLDNRSRSESLQGLIDTTGKLVLDLGPWVDAHRELFNLSEAPSLDLIFANKHETVFSDGLLHLPIGKIRGIFVDPKGQWVDLRKFIPERHVLGDFVDGWVPILAGNSHSDVRGFMDRKGNTLLVGKLKVHERAARVFRCGLVLIHPWEKEDLVEFWDRTGTRVLGPFNDASSFNAYGMACVQPMGPKGLKEPYYFIDPKGNKVLGPYSGSATFDRFGVAIVSDPATPGDRYYIDAKGRRLGPVPKTPEVDLPLIPLRLVTLPRGGEAPPPGASSAAKPVPPTPPPSKKETRKPTGPFKDM